MPGWTLTFASAYVVDLRALPVFDHARIQAAVSTSLPAEPDRPARHRRALKAPVSWCPNATWQLRVGDYRVLYRLEGNAGRGSSRKIESAPDDRRDGAEMKKWYTQAEVDDEVRHDVSAELSRLIATYDGSPLLAKEILGGLAAARLMRIDCSPFEDALAARHQAMEAA
jgi:mRNA-degrading endonuclease RelE of RelBE toxin-antitoxin system